MAKKWTLAHGTGSRPTSMATAAALLLGALLVLCCAPSGADAQGVATGTNATAITLGKPGRKLLQGQVTQVALGGEATGTCTFTVKNLCRNKPFIRVALVFYTTESPIGSRVPGYESSGWWKIPRGETFVFTNFLRAPAVRFRDVIVPQPFGKQEFSGLAGRTGRGCLYRGDGSWKFFSRNQRPEQWYVNTPDEYGAYPSCELAGGVMDNFFQPALSCNARHTVIHTDC